MGRSSSGEPTTSKRHHHSKKKKHHRSTSSSSSCKSSTTKEDKFDKRLHDERKKLHNIKKSRLKELETPEEKRARRLAKKLAKEQKRKERLGWGEQHLGYSNIDNPFGDTNLTDTFVWKKKLENDGNINMPLIEIKKRGRERVEKNSAELEKLKRLREAREANRADIEMMHRENEAKQFKEWEKMEGHFHLSQAKLRSQIRIKEGRAKAIDLLAKYINAEEDDDDIDVELVEPYNYLSGLTARDLEDLLEDIKVYRALENDKNADYWKDVKVICEEELGKLQRLDPSSTDFVGERARDAIHNSVQRDVARIFKGKNHRELALLETEILKKLHSQQVGVDVPYWESMLSHLKTHMAKARLRERHQETMKRKLAKLKSQQQLVDLPTVDNNIILPTVKPIEILATPITDMITSSSSSRMEPEEEARERDWNELTPEERANQTMQLYRQCGYSPVYQTEFEVRQPGMEIIDELEDIKRRDFNRNEMKSTGTTLSQREAMFEAEARKGMSKEEAMFSVEAPLEAQTFLWSDKYRPRKPRYFNRVHTGFEWNKYNQTHYDLDNPPPKIVQGYRFNIFYPDLLDPTNTPSFTVTPCEDKDFAVLRFHAGPPYEDMAFKLVNREWEINHKHGYRCQFQNGIFQLWFHFKKYRYRR